MANHTSYCSRSQTTNSTRQPRTDHDALLTPTQQVRVLGPRTVQESRSEHWYGYTVVTRVREPGGDWREVYREEVRGAEHWDPQAVNKLGGLGACVTTVPSPEAVAEAVCRATAWAVGHN